MIDNEYEFRRGYNYGFSDGNAEGKAWEQRRIIKLLEAWSCGLDDCPEWRVNSEKVIEFCNTRNSLIALIKGEK